MNKFLTLILTILFLVGTSLSLMELYSSENSLEHPFIASLYYLGTSIIIVLIVIRFSKDISKKVFIINSLIISLFTIMSILFALICLYTLVPQSRVESLASSIFFFAGMLAGSSTFFVSDRIKY